MAFTQHALPTIEQAQSELAQDGRLTSGPAQEILDRWKRMVDGGWWASSGGHAHFVEWELIEDFNLNTLKTLARERNLSTEGDREDLLIRLYPDELYDLWKDKNKNAGSPPNYATMHNSQLMNVLVRVRRLDYSRQYTRKELLIQVYRYAIFVQMSIDERSRVHIRQQRRARRRRRKYKPSF